MDDAPKKLIDALRAMHAHTPAVPGEVDQRMLAAARRRLRTRPRVLRWVAAGAVAAAGLIAFAASQLLDTTQQQHAAPAAHVTILDAFALARRLEAGTQDRKDDINGDGKVDRRDVHDLAVLAVALPPRAGGGK